MIRKSLLSIATSLVAMSAFACTVVAMTVDGGAGFPVASVCHYQLA